MRVSIASAIACAVATMAIADPSQAFIKRSVNIAAQDLSTALREFADESKLYLIYAQGDVVSHRTAGASGELSQDEVLKQLLEGTGLTYKLLDSNTITIVPIATAAETKTSHQGSTTMERLKFAQLEPSSNLGSKDQSEFSENAKLEEIVVTAQRRKETLQDVPISITVFSGKDLDASTASGVVQVLQAAPGFDSLTDLYSGGTVAFSVRGVSAAQTFGGGSGPVAFYLDGVPYGFLRNALYPDPNVYDLNQIEVLSGPQGTLYGAGSLNGVIRVLTHDANADEFEFKARTSISAVEDGGENLAGDMAINVPIIEGVLGVRATAGFSDDAGWIDTVQSPSDYGYSPLPEERRDMNDSEQQNYRLKVHFQPTSTLAVDLTAWRLEYEVGGPTWSDANRTTIALLDQTQGQEFTTYSARIANQFSGFTLTSTTSHVDFSSGGVTSAEAIPIPITLDTTRASEVFSQEFNLVSTGEGPWSWSAGAFYRSAEENKFQLFNSYGALGSVATFPSENFSDTSKSYAVFGEVGYDLTPELQLTVGLRYFNDEQTLTLFQDYSRSDTGVFLPAGTQNDSSFDATTPRIVLTWTPSKEQTFYASYAQGFRSGMAQEPSTQIAAPGGFAPAEPDLLTNYEVGAKGAILSGRLFYEAAVFYMDWQDVQQVGAVTREDGATASSVIFNAPGASGIGASFGLSARLVEGLEVGANVSWNDLTVDETFTAGGGTFQEGERLMFSPETTINADIQYEWTLGGDYFATISLDGSYRSPQTGRTTAGTTAESQSIYIANIAFLLETPFGWNARLFADNATDENNTSAPGIFPSWSPRQHPRVFGLQLAYAFK